MRKNWSSWLKGGLIAIGTLIVLFLLIFFVIPVILSLDTPLGIAILLLLPGWIPLRLFDIHDIPVYLVAIFSLPVYFLLGALIGWIIGKIKSK